MVGVLKTDMWFLESRRYEMIDRGRIYNLVDKVCDLSIKAIDKITELKQENSKLKQQVAELEKPKKKRKFRVMTFGEFCYKHRICRQCPMYDNITYSCIAPYFESNDPFRTKNGKYILIEVKE